MKSLFLVEKNVVELREVPVPEIDHPDSIRVRVTVTTICGGDIHLVAGLIIPEVGFSIGHEWVGVVDAVGANVTSVKVGDRVTGPAAPYCGHCAMCERGQIQACLNGGVHGNGTTMGHLDGAQAEYMIVPWANSCVLRLPDSINDETAIVIGDILSTGWTAVRDVKKAGHDTIVVIGCGPVGLSSVMTAKAEGFTNIIAVDRADTRLTVARQLGATHTVVADTGAGSAINAIAPGGVLGVVDAAGVQGSLDLATEIIGVGGRIAILGIPGAPLSVNIASLLMRNVTVWTGLGDLSLMPAALELLTSGTVDPSPLFTHHIGLDELPAMYETMASGAPEILKVIVRVSE